MFNKCPGQDGRNLRVSLHKCPECNGMLEIFSDESRVKCSKCKTWVQREASASCFEWCASARECMGDRFPGKKPDGA